jgi:cell division protease FtsH
MILPKEDKYYKTKTNMEEIIVHLLGGRVAEKLTLHEISTGASNDIERATEIARAMVTKYGMSEKLGPVNYSSSDEVFLGKDFSTRKNYSEEMAKEIDEEIRTIIEDAFTKAENLLSENIEKLHLIANVLLDLETLDADQFEKLFTGEKTAEELIRDTKELERHLEVVNAKEAAQHLAELAEDDEYDDEDDVDDEDDNDDDNDDDDDDDEYDDEDEDEDEE